MKKFTAWWSYLKSQGEPDYIEGLLEGGTVPTAKTAMQMAADLFGGGGGEKDPMYDQAVESGSQEPQGQHLPGAAPPQDVGYNRAARLVEDMENAGLVSAMSTSGQREILVPARNET
jgi:S-DNA-T family DNA segregation ATPase FtsK/SpoIIIE